MEIKIFRYLAGASRAEGTAVVIDVFRAFSTACYLYEAGVHKILLAETPEEAINIGRVHAGHLLVGEKGGRRIEGFDLGNSPSAVMSSEIEGRTAVFSTSAGTRGIIGAAGADEILTGSFVNVLATARYILKSKPSMVSMVCMGWNGEERADEDELYAGYLRNILTGREVDFSEIYSHLKYKSRSKSFLMLEDEKSGPAADFDLCLSLDRFDFALKAESGSPPALVKARR